MTHPLLQALADFFWVPSAPAQTQQPKAPDRLDTAQWARMIWEAEGRPAGSADRNWQAALAIQTALADNPEWDHSLSGHVERLQFESDLAEVQLLLDFISGSSSQTFSWQAPPAPAAAGTPAQDETAQLLAAIASPHVTVAELIRVAKIRFPPTKTVDANALDAVLLIALRDKLNRFVAPASGLTVAFTLRTWAFLATAFRPVQFTRHWARWRLANKAFPSLGFSVFNYLATAVAIFLGGIVITVFTLGISYTMTEGQALLDRIAALSRQQDTQTELISQLEAAIPAVATPSPNTGAPPLVLRYCERALIHPKLAVPGTAGLAQFDNAQQYETCDRLQAIGAQLRGEYAKSAAWYQNLRGIFGHSLIMRIGLLLNGHGDACEAIDAQAAPLTGANGAVLPSAGFFCTADLLADVTKVLLPVLYGLIGAIVAVLRGIVAKVSASMLAPWDAGLMWTRLLLGAMAGACIGLFFSPTATDLTASPGLTSLSLSAVAFLAGYAVDGLFSLFDEIIQRLFRLKPEGKSEGVASH